MYFTLRNNTDVIAYFAGDNEIFMSRPKSAAVKDIDIGDIFDHNYRHQPRGYRPISNTQGDIDPALIHKVISTHLKYTRGYRPSSNTQGDIHRSQIHKGISTSSNTQGDIDPALIHKGISTHL